jgi:GH35 family endo-1,4-beta-xylanase
MVFASPAPAKAESDVVTPAAAAQSLKTAHPELFRPSDSVRADGQTVAPKLSDSRNAEVATTDTLVSTRVADSFKAGVTVSTEATHTSLMPLGSADSATSFDLLSPNIGLFANAFPATDLAVRPTALGVEEYLQLRAPSAPQEFSWHVSLLPGQHLQVIDQRTVAVVGEAAPAPVNGIESNAPPPISSPLAASLHRNSAPHGTLPPPQHIGSPGARPTTADPSSKPPANATALEKSILRGDAPPITPGHLSGRVRNPPPLVAAPAKSASSAARESSPRSSSARGQPGSPSETGNTSHTVVQGEQTLRAARRQSAGGVLLLIRVPWAQDANGVPVSMQLSAHGSTVTTTIAHHDTDKYRYPLVAATTTQSSPARNLDLDAALRYPAFFSGYLPDPTAYANTFIDDFDGMTVENGMLMAVPDGTVAPGYTGMWPREPSQNADGTIDPGTDYGVGDALVNYARSNGKVVRGHALIWYASVPEWIKAPCSQDPNSLYCRYIQEANDPIDFKNLVNYYLFIYVTSVVQHYAGAVSSWDVVNEIIGPNGGLRVDPWYIDTGSYDYIANAFTWARDEDPNVRLLDNEYNADVQNSVSDSALSVDSGLKQQGTPINGTGFELHMATNAGSYISYQKLLDNWNRFGNAGLELEVTEMDVEFQPHQTSYDPNSAEAQTQKGYYIDASAACRDVPACKRFTVWGVGDQLSWKNTPTATTPSAFPLLFDTGTVINQANGNREYHAKQAYTEVVDRIDRDRAP